MSLKVGDLVKFYYFELYGIIVEQTPHNNPIMFNVNWFNGTLGSGYRASHLIKISDG